MFARTRQLPLVPLLIRERDMVLSWLISSITSGSGGGAREGSRVDLTANPGVNQGVIREDVGVILDVDPGVNLG